MTIGKRLLNERKRIGYARQGDFGKALGVSFNTISRWENEENPIPSDKLIAMQKLGIDIAFILTGTNLYKVSNTDDNLIDDEIPSESENNAKFEKKNLSFREPQAIYTYNSQDNQDDTYAFVPLYDVEASAGGGSFLDNERVKTKLSFTRHSLKRQGLEEEYLACLLCRGDSMTPTIHERDTIMIDLRRKEADGGIFVFRHENSLFVKRLIREKGGIRVISDNQIYPEWVIEPHDDYEIIGKKVWQARWDR